MSKSVAASIEERLNELANWPIDGEYLIEEMSTGAMNTAAIILGAMELTTSPAIFRMSDGGVSIEWTTKDTVVSIEIPPEAPWNPEFFYYFTADDTLTPTPESVIVAPSPRFKRRV